MSKPGHFSPHIFKEQTKCNNIITEDTIRSNSRYVTYITHSSDDRRRSTNEIKQRHEPLNHHHINLPSIIQWSRNSAERGN